MATSNARFEKVFESSEAMIRNFASVLRSRSSDQGSSHMPPLPYCSALGSPG